MGKGNVVVVGSGISGLLAALLLAKSNANKKVFIIEKNKEIGGLLRRFYYGDEFGSFDYGMHNMLETGEKELDDLIFSLLPANEWQLLEGKNRDLAGVFFNNVLQYNTPYIDVRNLSKEETDKCIAEFFEHIKRNPSSNKEQEVKMTAKDVSCMRFGNYVAEKTIIPSVEKVHQRPAEELDYMATLFTPMNRIAMYSEPKINELTKSDILRERLAFCDQRNLPLERSSGRKAFYPIKYGMYRVIDALANELEKYQVEILTESELTEVKCEGNRITELHISTGENKLRIPDISLMVWTGNLPLLGRTLKVNMSDLGFDKPLKTIVVSILIDKPLNMQDLYYFFCYQKGFHTYRLNNFSAYCKGAPRNGNYPISIELLMNNDDIVNSKLTFEEIALDELRRFNVLQEGTKIVFAKAEPLESGFPLPSSKNVFALNQIRDRIKNLKLENCKAMGILSEPNLFFQTDVLRDTYLKLKNHG